MGERVGDRGVQDGKHCQGTKSMHSLRFVEGEAAMLVSRGLGDTLPVRFNCPREVLLCELA